MEPRIISKPAFAVVGLLQHEEGNSRPIESLWSTLGARLSEIRGADPDVGFGVHLFKQDAHRYLVGFAASNGGTIPTGMTSHQFNAQDYAIITHQGSLDGINDTLHAFFKQWLPGSGYLQDGTCYFEVYDDRFDPGSPDSIISIYVPVKKNAI